MKREEKTCVAQRLSTAAPGTPLRAGTATWVLARGAEILAKEAGEEKW